MSEYNSDVARWPSSGRESHLNKSENRVFSPQSCTGVQRRNVATARCHIGRKQPKSATHGLRIFKPGEDAPDIYKFRYKIYEGEMQRNDQYADHEKKTIKDPFDDYAYNIGAFKDGKITGTARINFCADGNCGFYRDFLELETAGASYPQNVAFSSRLMVVKSERRRLLPLMLSAECFNIALARRAAWSFLDCNQHLVSFYERMCFEVQNPSKLHPCFGDVAVMRVDLSDQRIFDKRRSIVARYIRP